MSLSESVVPIEIFEAGSSKRTDFGNGFVIYRQGEDTYILTSAHVVQKSSSKEIRIRVDYKFEAKVVAISVEEELDLAVLLVSGLNKPVLPLYPFANAWDRGVVIGLQEISEAQSLARRLEVKLGRLELRSKHRQELIIKSWELQVLSDHPLVPGHSGSPVLNENGNKREVIGVVTARETGYYSDGKTGLAISIENLQYIWKNIPHDLLQSLKKTTSISPISVDMNKYNYIKQAKVMIGTSTSELFKHRGEVMKTLQDIIWRTRLYPLVNEDITQNNSTTFIRNSMELVENATVYIGLIGLNYGHIPQNSQLNPNHLSLMELEYRRALARGIPALTFIVGEEHQFSIRDIDYSEGVEAKQKLESLKQEIIQRREVWYFNSVEELRMKILPELEKIVTYNVANSLDKETESRDYSINHMYLLPALPNICSIPPYILTNKFIGRKLELSELDMWAASDQPVMVIEAIGGEGKSALTWEWTNNHARNIMAPAGIIWWSFYERGATVASFVRYALAYVTQQNPEKLKEMPYQEQIIALLFNLEKANFLLVMDGLERILVAYHRFDRAHVRDHEVENRVELRDCTDPRDTDFLKQLATLRKSKVLISTRLMPGALKDAGEPIIGVKHKQLQGLNPEDARTLLFDRGVKKLISLH